MKIAFDYKKYLDEQTKYILERAERFNNKLYLEFGGKLFYDYHASRVLPGYDVNAKVKLLRKLKDQAEIIICVYAGAIEKNKIRADFGITYDLDVLRLIDDLRSWDLNVNSVVITRYEEQPAALIFKKKLERRGIKTYTHKFTKGYPTDVDVIVSEEGYGKNEYITTTKPVIVVAAPGPGSGKLATCLSQLYHEHVKGVGAGYSKFETFPIWNLPLKHPVNIAYEAATVDLNDKNMIDSFHLENRNEIAVNYNRDMEVFPVVERIIEKITGTTSIYKSPTDMGVNRAGFAIYDDEVVKEAAKQEIIRRLFKTDCEYKQGQLEKAATIRIRLIMDRLNLKAEDRKVVEPAREAARLACEKFGSEGNMGAAMMLPDGRIITGKGSKLMNSSSSLIINAIKVIMEIKDRKHLIEPEILKPIMKLKKKSFGSRNPKLNMEEVLIALSISANTKEEAKLAFDNLNKLKGCEVHTTHILSKEDEEIYRKLGINLTSDPVFKSKELYYI